MKAKPKMKRAANQRLGKNKPNQHDRLKIENAGQGVKREKGVVRGGGGLEPGCQAI